MINNYEKIKPLLSFDSEDDFYFLQIIQRKKDNPEFKKSMDVKKSFYIASIERLEQLQPEIIDLCIYYKARAYIHLAKRSFEKVAFALLEKTAKCFMNRDFKSLKTAYDSCCGTCPAEKKWIVDIDTKDRDCAVVISNYINSIEPTGENKIIALIETKNGCHIISKPFNCHKFSKVYPGIDIHKNNPTLLYCS
jgi:hypothetical protein